VSDTIIGESAHLLSPSAVAPISASATRSPAWKGATAILQLVTRFPALRRNGAFTRGGRARFRGYASYPIAVAQA
jgi:hypothetical protein